MKRTLLVGSLAAIAILYLSWRNHHDNDKAPTPPAPQSVTATNGGGQPVSWAQIKPCLAAYKDVMKKYGITEDNPRKPITKCPDSTYLITLSEAFHADSLMAWLNAQIQQLDPQGGGKNLNFVIMPGICTAEMVRSAKAAKMQTGRISFFIVPQPRNGGRFKGPNGDPPGGFEVGGLQP
jgi:hypothetical protein